MRLQILSFLLAISSLAYSQETGHKDFPTLGISFAIPEGWVGQAADAGYVMGSYTQPGILLAMTHQTRDLNQLRSEAAAGVQDQQGTQLALVGAVGDFKGDGITAHYEGTVGWQPAKAYAVSRLNPHGDGVTLIYMTTTAEFKDEISGLVDQTAATFKFTKVIPPPAPPVAGNSGTNWHSKFTNARLTYMNSYYSSGGSYGGYSTGGGYSDKEIIDLCAQGHFKFYSSSSMSMDTGGAFGNAHSRDGGAGTWKIAKNAQGQNVLELSFHNGTVKQYVLSLQDGKTFLDGYRYYCTYGNITDDGPDCF